MAEPRLRLLGLEPPRLIFQVLVPAVLPFWGVLTVIAWEQAGGGEDGQEGWARVAVALAGSTSLVVVLILLLVPALVLLGMTGRRRSRLLDDDDLGHLAQEVADAPVLVRIVRGELPPSDPGVVRLPPRVEVRPPLAPSKPEASAASDELDDLFR